MRYQLRQKLFSWGDDFVIRDTYGNDVFFVDGRAFSFGNKLSFQNMAGNELVFIRQKVFSWGPTYEIAAGGRLVAIVTKKLFTFFRCRFTVDVPGPNDLIAQGDFLHHEYDFSRFERPVARVSRQWFSFSDVYGVEIASREDDVLILASAVVIDQVCHEKDD